MTNEGVSATLKPGAKSNYFLFTFAAWIRQQLTCVEFTMLSDVRKYWKFSSTPEEWLPVLTQL